jgi:lipoate-protein ligase A
MDTANQAQGTCRVIPLEAGDGPTNMALDEVLLESVASDPTSAVFRTYTWTEPTLSLGYFQSIQQAEAEPRWRDVPLVRRPTGGGALWHHHELTYAVIVPKSHALARRSPDLYFAVHAAIAELLREHGIQAGRRGDVAGTATSKPFLCFADRDSEDVVAGEVKIVGSAQRRRAGAVLQHGSVLLQQSPITPELVGAGELGVSLLDFAIWSKWLSEAVPRALGLSPIVSEFSGAERAGADRLIHEVYRNDSWTKKR